MANQPPPPPQQQPEGIVDDFFEQIFSMPSSYVAAGDTGLAGHDGGLAGVPLHRNSADAGGGGGPFSLGLSLEQGSSSGKRLREDPEGKTLRRERIAERIRALQELVPNTNKTDRAAMLDEILDYVKFLRLQVKVLSMSRLGGAGAVAQLIADIPLSVEVWEKWSTDGTERQVAKLMEEDIGAAMQFLQSKALCMMPISLAMAIYDTHQTEAQPVKPEPNTPT
ncbi:hypothetical protein B296_00057707 [Ensete ventricosum]|uniref:BHLH domain-containing protein n=1 Tax=Ensete ventricosum TaxID=4639 RepID=A0A426XQB6_ENSVE|nr:hypothetical protein B296_00057707 [Ensete ventricosum]